MKDFIQDEPDDWTLAFPEVKLQVFFLVKASAASGTTSFCSMSAQYKMSFQKALKLEGQNFCTKWF